MGAKRLTTELVGSREESLAADAPQAVGERLLALVEPYPGAQRLVRRAWRSAQRLGAELDLLWVRTPGQRLSEDEERSLAALRQLASVLGARMLEEESDDVAAAIVDVAARRGSTYILLGRSRPARGLARLRVPLPQRLMARLPGVDVRIVADRSSRSSAREAMSAALDLHQSPPAAPSLGIAAGYWLPPHGRRARRVTVPGPCAASCSRSPDRRSPAARFEAAVRLAKAENAIVMPAFLARVPMNLPLEIGPAGAVRQRDAAARGDRAAPVLAGRAGRLARRPRALRPRRAAQTARRRSSSTASSSPPTKTRTWG